MRITVRNTVATPRPRQGLHSYFNAGNGLCAVASGQHKLLEVAARSLVMYTEIPPTAGKHARSS
jgi:hypothetical protein